MSMAFTILLEKRGWKKAGEDLGCFTQIECRVPVGRPSASGSDH